MLCWHCWHLDTFGTVGIILHLALSRIYRVGIAFSTETYLSLVVGILMIWHYVAFDAVGIMLHSALFALLHLALELCCI